MKTENCQGCSLLRNALTANRYPDDSQLKRVPNREDWTKYICVASVGLTATVFLEQFMTHCNPARKSKPVKQYLKKTSREVVRDVAKLDCGFVAYLILGC